jgi:hypothetical protein
MLVNVGALHALYVVCVCRACMYSEVQDGEHDSRSMNHVIQGKGGGGDMEPLTLSTFF